MRSLAYKTCILEWERPILLCQHRNVLYLLIFRLRFNVFLCFATAVQHILHYVLFTLPCNSGIRHTIISSVGCSKCSRHKYLYVWRNYLPPFTKVVLNGHRFWVIWWTTWTRDLCTALNRHYNIHRWLRTASNWELSVVFLSTNVPKMFDCSVIYLNLKSVIVWLFKNIIFL